MNLCCVRSICGGENLKNHYNSFYIQLIHLLDGWLYKSKPRALLKTKKIGLSTHASQYVIIMFYLYKFIKIDKR